MLRVNEISDSGSSSPSSAVQDADQKLCDSIKFFEQRLEALNQIEDKRDVIEDDLFSVYGKELYKEFYRAVKNNDVGPVIQIRVGPYSAMDENAEEKEAPTLHNISVKFICKMGADIFKPSKRMSLQQINEITEGLCRYQAFLVIKTSYKCDESLGVLRAWRLLLESLLAFSKHIMQNMQEVHLYGYRLYHMREGFFNDLVRLTYDEVEGERLPVYHQDKAEAFIAQVERNLLMTQTKIQAIIRSEYRHRLLSGSNFPALPAEKSAIAKYEPIPFSLGDEENAPSNEEGYKRIRLAGKNE